MDRQDFITENTPGFLAAMVANSAINNGSASNATLIANSMTLAGNLYDTLNPAPSSQSPSGGEAGG